MNFEDGQLVAEQPLYETLWKGRQKMYRRAAKVKGQDQQKWAILPNIEGQKYTLGNKFTSREEERELLFWDRDNGDMDAELKQMCQITVVNNKYFIQPLMGNRVALNNVEILTREELKFGDRLSIGKKPRDHSKHWTFIPSPTNFLFEKREAVEVDVGVDGRKASSKRGTIRLSQRQKEVASAVGLNLVILQLLLAHFPVSILKGLRFVCKTWNQEIIKVLKKKGQLSFHFPGDRRIRSYHPPRESMKIFTSTWDLRNNPIPNIYLALPILIPADNPRQSTTRSLNTSEGGPGAKLLSDLDHFFFKCPIKSLVLRGVIESKADFDIRMKVLEHVQFTLEELDFRGTWYEKEWEMTNFIFPSSIGFKKLKMLSIGIWRKYSDATLQVWLQPFILAVKGVSALQICGNSSTATLAFLENINNFPNLNEITLVGALPREQELLLNLKKPLKKLRLYRPCSDPIMLGIEDIKYFERLIKYHGPTLEDLHFVIPSRTLPATIHLPALPKLKKLEIEMFGNQEEQKLVFPIAKGNKIAYDDHLPSLQSLTLWPRSWTEHDTNPFFTEGAVCKTLRVLEIEGFSTHPRIGDFAVIFPNVFNNWMNEARRITQTTTNT